MANETVYSTGMWTLGLGYSADRAVLIAHPDLEAFVGGGHGIIGTAVQAAMDDSMNQTPESRLHGTGRPILLPSSDTH